jgi:hypothetical protein
MDAHALVTIFMFAVGLAVGTWRGWQIGAERGRYKERVQVIAFLNGKFRQADQMQDVTELAKMINAGEHLAWDYVDKPQGPSAA